MNAKYQSLRYSINYPNAGCTEELAHRWYNRDRRYKPPTVVDLSVCFRFREDRHNARRIEIAVRAKNTARSFGGYWGVRLADTSDPRLF
jgi:hypothetical protein